MSELFEYTCSSCRKSHLVDGSEITYPGVWRSCPSCGEQVFVTPEGVSSGGAAPTPAPSASEAPGVHRDDEGQGLGIHLRMPGGDVAELSAEAIEHGIQSGRIRPWDLISEDRQDFYPISQHAELQNLFVESDFIPVVQRRCANHKESLIAGTCRQCGRGYCDACLTKMGHRVCPACHGAIQDPDPRLKETPPWKRWREVARFPIDGDAVKATAVIGVLLWLASSSIYAAPLYLLVLAAVVHALLEAARGRKEWRLSPEIDFRGLGEKMKPAALLTVLVAIPFAAAPFLLGVNLGVLVQFPLTLLAFFYYPMALGLVLVDADQDRALKPRNVLKAAGAVKEDYFAIVVLLIAVSLGVVAAQTVLSFIPWLGSLIGSVVLAYGLVVQAYLVGWLFYMNRERILAAY